MYVVVRKNEGHFYLDHAGSSVFWTSNPVEAEMFQNIADAKDIADIAEGLVKTVKCTLE